MKKAFKILSLTFISFTAGICGLFSNNMESASAVTSRATAFTDNFNSSNFDSSWTAKDAELGKDYTALSLINWDVWQPSVNLLKYKIEAESTIIFDINFISGQWGGICFGLPYETTRFCYASCAIFMYQEKTWMEVQGESGELSASASSGIANISKSCFAGLNVLSTVRMDVHADKSIDISAAKKGETLQPVGTFTAYRDKGFEPGYLGFAGMGESTYDIVNFQYIHNGDVVYQDDFTTSKLGGISTGVNGYDWFISYYYGDNNTRIGASGYLKLENAAYALYDKELENNHISENQFEISFKMMINKLNANDYFGAGFSLANNPKNILDGNFIGLVKKESNIYFASFNEGYETIGDKVLLSQNVFYKITISGNYNDYLTISISGNGVNATNSFICKFEGRFGLGTLSSGNSVSIRVDDFSLDLFSFNSSQAKDVAINFEGIISEYDADEDYTYHDYYINKYEYYVGTNVIHLPYKEDKQGNRVTDNDKLSFSSRQNDVSSMAVFAPKYQYSNSVIRFDIQMNSASKSDLTNARIGVGFGMKSTYFYPTKTPYFFFQRTSGETLVGGRGMTPNVSQSKEHCNDVGANNYYKCSYDLWNGDTTTIYNIMLVVENGNVKVYYKANYQPDSMLKILRCEFDGADTYGYVSVFSYDGASFYLNNLSVTNIDSFKNKDGEIKDFDYTNTSIKNNILSLNNQSLESQNEYFDSLALFKLKGKNGGSLNIDFADQHYEIAGDDISNETQLRIKLFNGRYEICTRQDGPETDLYSPIYEGTFDNSTFFKLSISSVGEVDIYSSSYTSLESSIEIPLGDYDPEYESQFIQNVIRDSITDSKLDLLNKVNRRIKPFVLVLFIAGGCVAAAAIAITTILLIKKRKTK